MDKEERVNSNKEYTDVNRYTEQELYTYGMLIMNLLSIHDKEDRKYAEEHAYEQIEQSMLQRQFKPLTGGI